MVAYEEVYLNAPERLKDFYQHVYRELSFFVDDDLYRSFNAALDVAAKCRWEEAKKRGTSRDLSFYRRLIVNQGVVAQSEEEIWAGLVHDVTCPREHTVLVAQTLIYCSSLFHAMDAEWVAFANLVAYRKKLLTP